MFVAVALGGLVLAGCLPPPPPPSGPPLPQRIAAVGDSITTATDAGWCCVDPHGSNPQYSWSTGTDFSVNSHLRRIDALNGSTKVAALTAAQPGADSGDLQAQLSQASAFGAQYVTVLMGGNDLCWGPTPTDEFRQRVTAAFDAFFTASPNARLFVASVPNLYHLWAIEHDDPWAQFIWNLFDICPTMLPSSVTDQQRQSILTLEVQFNNILATACGEHPNCRWDDNTVFDYQFTTSDISPVDHYHPSIQGQNTLATITWATSFWGS
jgi:lysophospholipase L1-like esterase